MEDTSPGVVLAQFAASMRFDAVPTAVVRRTEDLLLDWIGSALAGKGARPVESIAKVMLAQASRKLCPLVGPVPLVACDK